MRQVEEVVKTGWPNLTKGFCSITATSIKKTLEALKSKHITLGPARNVKRECGWPNSKSKHRRSFWVPKTQTRNRHLRGRKCTKSSQRKSDLTANRRPLNEARQPPSTLTSKEVSMNRDVDYSKPITVVNSWKENVHLVIRYKNSEEIVTPFYIFPTTALNHPYGLTPTQLSSMMTPK